MALAKRKIVGGHHVGAVARRVYRCDGCGFWHEHKPPLDCGMGPCRCSTFTHFASRQEAKRWAALELLQKAGQIKDLKRQVEFPLHAYGPQGSPALVGKYLADAAYTNLRGQKMVEDSKGADTALSAWKRRHVEAQYGVVVQLT